MSIVYNDYNAPRSFTTAMGATNIFYYDEFGNKVSSTNEYNQTTTYKYDSKWITGLGAVSSNGWLLEQNDPNGMKTTHTYDASGNVLTTTKTYTDNQGNVVTLTTTNTYDAFNRLTSSTDERGHTETYQYDARGDKIQTTDAQGRITKYEYTPSNKPTKTTYPDNTTESKTYDAMDNLLSQTNIEGETTSYEYDKADRLIKTTYADGTTSFVLSFPRYSWECIRKLNKPNSYQLLK